MLVHGVHTDGTLRVALNVVLLFCCCTKLSKNGQDMVMMITATRRWWHWWWWKQGIRFEVRTCLLLPGLACKTPFSGPFCKIWLQCSFVRGLLCMQNTFIRTLFLMCTKWLQSLAGKIPFGWPSSQLLAPINHVRHPLFQFSLSPSHSVITALRINETHPNASMSQ